MDNLQNTLCNTIRNPFYAQRRQIEREEQQLREEYLKLLQEDVRYQDIQARLKKNQEDCEKVGHKRGRFWDNNLGWEWYYCQHCNAIFDKSCYLLDEDLVGVTDAD